MTELPSAFSYYLDTVPELPIEGLNELALLRSAYEGALKAGLEEAIQQTTTSILNCIDKWQRVKAADTKLAANERRKYSATFLNGIANTLVGAGIATPVISAVLPGNPIVAQPWLLAGIGGVCSLTVVALHLTVRWLLGGLRA